MTRANVEEAARLVGSRSDFAPEIGFILGTGLGALSHQPRTPGNDWHEAGAARRSTRVDNLSISSVPLVESVEVPFIQRPTVPRAFTLPGGAFQTVRSTA